MYIYTKSTLANQPQNVARACYVLEKLVLLILHLRAQCTEGVHSAATAGTKRDGGASATDPTAAVYAKELRI